MPFASKPAWACSCVSLTKAEQGAQAVAVFTGTAARIDEVGSRRVVNFDVDTVYKGSVDPSIDVKTGRGGGDCGVEFEIDERYTVFASGSTDSLGAGTCGGNPVVGDIDPAAYGLGPGSGLDPPVTGLHRPLPVWLIVFTILAGAIAVTALVLTARRRRRTSG